VEKGSQKWCGRRPISQKVEDPKKNSGNSGPTHVARGGSGAKAHPLSARPEEK